MWNQPLIPESYDIIIDDGLHEFDASITFFMNSIYRLNKNGLYIIEDITSSDIEKWHNFKYIGYSFQIVKLQNSYNKDDNNIIIIKNITCFYSISIRVAGSGYNSQPYRKKTIERR